MYCDQAAVYGNPRRTRRSGCLSYIGTLGLQNKFHMFQTYDSQKYEKIGQSPQQFVSQLKFEYVSIHKKDMEELQASFNPGVGLERLDLVVRPCASRSRTSIRFCRAVQGVLYTEGTCDCVLGDEDSSMISGESIYLIIFISIDTKRV